MKHAILTTDQCRQVDELAIAGGVSGIDLMAHAGLAVARVVQNEYPDRQLTVLAGPGNNGGDAIVAAIELDQAGCKVDLVTMVPLSAMTGDAHHFADQWEKDYIKLSDFQPAKDSVIIDGLFGAGINKDLPPEAIRFFDLVDGQPIVAIDLPSGIHGDTGQLLTTAPQCEHTITFFRLKPGHLLYPGRRLCGITHVCDIGIADDYLEIIKPQFFCNHTPDLSRLRPVGEGNKFSRGCLAIVASGNMCGASQLAARAAQRSGSGLVYILSPPDAVRHYQQSLASVPVISCSSPYEIISNLQNKNISAIVIGPGLIEIENDPGFLEQVIRLQKPTLIDASAITALAKNPDMLKHTSSPLIVTPHAGEFKRMFPDLDTCNLPQAVEQAATRLGCVVLYKGHTSLIASPQGKVIFNITAKPDLATAGSGDVLAGIAGSLLAQGWQAEEAASCACWWHSEAGTGFGLIAEDIIEALATVARYHLRKSNE